MKEKNEHPKVFISYSWSSKEYEEKVMDLAVKLQGDGIEVIIDKWIMQAGNDTIDFMEKCVKDSTVNFVLMLLDKKYTEKADKRSGGVGIETQIISSEVYNNVGQSKFIPIVFDRDDDGKIFVRELVAEWKEKYPKLASYMTRNISIMLSISSIHLLLIKTEEAEQKRRDMWENIKAYNTALYYRLRYSTLSGLTYLPGKLGGKLTVGGYRFARKIYQFQ